MRKVPRSPSFPILTGRDGVNLSVRQLIRKSTFWSSKIRKLLLVTCSAAMFWNAKKLVSTSNAFYSASRRALARIVGEGCERPATCGILVGTGYRGLRACRCPAEVAEYPRPATLRRPARGQRQSVSQPVRYRIPPPAPEVTVSAVQGASRQVPCTTKGAGTSHPVSRSAA